MPQCAGVMSGGRRCSKAAQHDRPWCWMHDPDKRDEAQEARRRGAATTNARKREPLPDFSDMPSPRTLQDVAAWQARVAEALVRGELDPRRGHELTYALRAAKETLEATDSAAKAKELLDEVEALRKAQGGRG